jgi:hypothetical protein
MNITYSQYDTVITGTHRTDEPIPKEWFGLKPREFVRNINNHTPEDWGEGVLEHYSNTMYWSELCDNDGVTISPTLDAREFVVTVKVSEGGQ